MQNIVNYWQKTVKQVFAILKTGADGLDLKEADRRFLRFGKNEISAQERRPALSILISQFKSPLVLILLGASLVSGFLGDIMSTFIIVAMVFISAILAFIQEYKSEKAVDDLREKVSLKAVVMRDGKIHTISASKIVRGDIVMLDLGKVVPADLRLISTDDLLIDESLLTGESFPVEKITDPLSAQGGSASGGKVENYSPQAMKNIAFMGTHVVQGSGRGVVIATAKETELGKTAHLLQAKPQETEFQKGIRNFGAFLIKVILIFSLFIFLFLAIFKHEWMQSLLFSLAIAVGISPELLPIIVTINLSRGARKMSKNHVIVKRLMSIEDMGNIDVLCTDKTGTLTEGRIFLKDYFDLQNKQSPEILKYAMLCNSLTVLKDGIGNPLDKAVADYFQHHNSREKLDDYKIIDDISFDFKRRRMSVVAEKAGKRILICKGAVDELLSICSKAKMNNHVKSIAREMEDLKEKFLQAEKGGLRLLLLAVKEIETKDKYDVKDEVGLTLIGFLSFADQPKETAREALDLLHGLGVDMKILTGDSEPAAAFLASEIGFKVSGIMDGGQIQALSDNKLKSAVASANIFVKITPEHKLRIINALKQAGHTVGFLGDGVNDAPSLRAADVGISVDSAVDVAKEAADVILLRKSLRVLGEGIKEGRRTFGNTLKYIFSTISSNYGNMFSVAGAAIILPYIPMLPTQILLLNFLSDFPMLAVSTDRVDVDYLKKPKHWDTKIISQFMVYFGLISSFFDFMTFGIMLIVFKASSSLFQTGWFWESFLTEVIIIFIIRTRKWFWQSRPGKMLFLSSAITACLVLVFIYTKLGAYFSFTPLPFKIFISLIFISLIYLAVTELGKKIFYRRYHV